MGESTLELVEFTVKAMFVMRNGLVPMSKNYSLSCVLDYTGIFKSKN